MGTLAGQGVLLAVSPLLTRLYRPEDFATLTVFTAIATVMGSIVTLSWERAIVIPRADRQAQSVLLLGAVTVIAIGLVFTIIAAIASPSLDNLFGTAVFARFWWLLPATVVVMGMFALLSSWLVRSRRFGLLAGRNVALGLSQAVSSVVLGIVGAGPIGLLSGMGVGRAAAVIGITPWKTLRRPWRQSPARVAVVAKRYRRFPLVATWSRVLNVLGLQLPPLLIVALFGTLEAGLYALTVRVLATPIGMVADAVSQYFEGTFSALVRARSNRLSGFIMRISARMFLLGLLPGMVIAVYAPPLFGWVFGEEWSKAGVFAQIVVAFYVLQLAISPVSRALLVLERQSMQLAWDISRMVLTVASVVAPALLGGSLAIALVLLTLTQVILYLVLLIVCVRVARRAERV